MAVKNIMVDSLTLLLDSLMRRVESRYDQNCGVDPWPNEREMEVEGRSLLLLVARRKC